MNRFVLTCAAIGLVAFGAVTARAGERPFTVVPMGIGMDAKTESVASMILAIHARSGVDRFVLHGPGHGVRTSGYYDEAGYRGVGRRVKAIQDAVAAKGIKVGFLMGPTMNVGINHPWTKFVMQNGKERPFTACPGDPAFRQAFAAHCAAVAAECRPFLYMMEDDFRLFWGRGCYCARHKEKPEQAMEDLVLLAEEAAKAIHRVSPETRIGLSAPGGYLEDAARLARALADGGKPFIRWYGTDYGFDVPMRLPEFLWTPLWTKQNLSEGMECVYEADAAPNTAFYGSGARVVASSSVMLANGYDGLWYWIGNNDPAGKFGVIPQSNLEAYARTCRDLAAVGACAREGHPVGVSTFTAPGGRLMARYGIPYRTTSGGVPVYAGEDAFAGRSDEEVKKILSGAALVDGDAACELTKRGFADLIGARATVRTGAIDFSGECVSADKAHVVSSFHQNYGLDDSEVRRLACVGGEEVSYYFSGSETNRVQSAVTRHVNALGGRIVVLATAFRNATPTNLLNYRKRQLIIDALAWLGGETAVPVRTGNEVNVLLFANEDAAKTRLFVHATQLSCDACDALTLVVAPPYRGGRVEVLEGGQWKPLAAVWCEGRVTVPRTLHLYDTLAVKILKVSAATVERDIVIYGSSPAALTAAVQAKRMGVSCVVVSPETRIGGLTTGGLGQTDIGNKSAFGGLTLDFYREVADYYRDEDNWTWQKRGDYLPDGQCAGTKGTDSMWTFEPSAALRILEGWEKKYDLDIRRGKRLCRERGKVKVEKVGGGGQRIVSFLTEDGTEYRGKMFVDATYEGDLMAAAGVSYTVGREDNSVYGESLSGCQRAQAKYHQFEKGVSGYVTPGDPKSGLLPGLAKDDGRSDGTGDRFVQAYCFRMCLTDCPKNRIPFKKPANYDEREYELLFRNLAAQEKAHPEWANDRAGRNGFNWINSRMPNCKTDTNNRLGVSTDFVGRNWDWPEASYAERARIFQAHLDYQRGLMWTLANHPRVPERMRDVFSRWGTCRDEFSDGPGDGWQSQLYVREARRMVGSYVMTEANCRGTKTARRPVAMAAYTMDSHHVRRLVDKDGNVFNEGDVQVGTNEDGVRFPPYPIDYGAIVPKRDECANLLVPVCLSASHIAFGSIRMEPVFFALGQAAGTAAAQAVASGCAIQDLPYGPLAARLESDGQVLVAEP